MSKDTYGRYSDEELISLAKAGDAAAEEELLIKYKQKVRSKTHLYFILGGDSEDIVQEGMIGLVFAIRSFDPSRGASFSTYAEKCVSSRILNAVKLAGRKKHQPLNSAISFDDPLPGSEDVTVADALASADSSDPESEILLSEVIDLINGPDQGPFSKTEKSVLKMLLEGKTRSEIAKKLEKDPVSIENAAQRAKKKLKNLLFT